MHKGFTKTTLGLLAAALLSSSAFAAGPTISQLPNVYITDLTPAPGAVPDEGDGATPATNIYRFTDAFVLGDYVDFDPDNNSTEDLGQVSWLFQEYAWDNTAAGQARTGTNRTIAIGEDESNAQLGLNQAAEASYADITGSTQPNVGVLATALDFVNQALTPDLQDNGSSPTSNFAPGVDAAVIELFVAASSVANEVDSTMFTVYTTNDDSFAEGDLVTVSSNIWMPETCLETFGGWEVEEVSPTDPPGDFSPTPTVPGNSIAFGPNANMLAANGTTGLYIETDDTPAGNTGTTQFQYISWKSMRRDVPGMVTIPVADNDTLFMVRWTISADAATVTAASSNRRGTSVQTPMLRLRSGEVSLGGNGQANEFFGAVGLNNVVEAGQEVRTFYYAKVGGNYDTGEGLTDPPNAGQGWLSDDDPPVVFGLYFDVLDTLTDTDAFATTVGGQRLYGVTLDKVEVYSTTRAALGNGTVVFNQGVDSFSVAVNEEQPTNDGRVGFDLRWWDSRDEGAGTRATFSPAEANVNSNTTLPLSYTIAGNDSPNLVVATWDTRDYASSAALAPPDGQGNGEEVVTVDNDVLVAVDVWMSSPQGGTPNNLLPGVVDGGGVSATRIGFQTDIWGGTGSGEGPTGLDDPDMPGTTNIFRQGRAGLFQFNSGNREQYDTAFILPATYALETAAKRITFFFEPQAIDDADGIDALSFRPTIQSYAAPGASTDLTADVNGTIQIQRVVITTYPMTLPDPICP